MSVIRVTPSTLRTSGQDLAQAGTNTAQIGRDLWSVGSGAPSYEGQFGSRVRDMAAEANAQAAAFARQLADYTNRLVSKAAAFEAADIVFLTGIGVIGLPADWRDTLDLLGRFGLWIGMPVAAIEKYLSLGLLGDLDSWLSHLVTGILPRSNFQVAWGGSTFPGIRVPASIDETVERFRNDLGGKGWKTDDELAAEKRKADDAKLAAEAEAAEVASEKQIEETKKRVQNDIARKQDDTAWAGDPMGDNGMTIGEVGCLITAIAMLARYEGADVSPADVNQYLRDNKGYETGSSYMEWGTAEAFLNSRLHTNDKQFAVLPVDENSISTELAAGHPVILHVPVITKDGHITEDGHWVLAVSKGGNGSFMAYDPLKGYMANFDIGQVTQAKSF